MSPVLKIPKDSTTTELRNVKKVEVRKMPSMRRSPRSNFPKVLRQEMSSSSLKMICENLWRARAFTAVTDGCPPTARGTILPKVFRTARVKLNHPSIRESKDRVHRKGSGKVFKST